MEQPAGIIRLEEHNDMVLALLVSAIKTYGENNVLRLPDVPVVAPFAIKIQVDDDEARLVLLEGEERMESWRTFSEVKHGSEETEVHDS